jgi:hypothetical protein
MHDHTGVVTASTQPTVHVLATTFDGTRAALTTAIPLTRGARSRLAVVVPYIVPYPIPLDRPADSTVFVERRYRELVHELDGEAKVTVYLCRRPDDVVSRVLPAGSTVVLGGGAGQWLASRHERVAHQLHRRGYRVVFVPVAARESVERSRRESQRLREATLTCGYKSADGFEMRGAW